MNSTSNEEILQLVHSFLKESHLMKTARSLEQETGEKFSSVVKNESLQHIINNYKNLSKIIQDLVACTSKADNSTKNIQKDSKNDTKSKPKKKNTKTQEGPVDTDVSTNNDNNETGVQAEKKPPPKIKAKPKREPLVQPGEWVAPEMESTLHAIYDRLRMKVGTVTNKYFGENESPVENNEIPEFEESDNNLPKIDVNKVLVRLSNGDVYESPSGKKKTPSDTDKNNNEDKENISEEKISKKKKKRKSISQDPSENSEKDILEIAEEGSFTKENSPPKSVKKAKKRKNQEKDEHGEKEDHKEKEEQSSVEAEVTKSKKKKHASEQEFNTTVVSINENVDTPKKKKKKNAQLESDEVEEQEENVKEEKIVTEKENVDEEDNDKKKKKKKKKKKLFNESENLVNGGVLDSQEDFISPFKKLNSTKKSRKSKSNAD